MLAINIDQGVTHILPDIPNNANCSWWKCFVVSVDPSTNHKTFPVRQPVQ